MLAGVVDNKLRWFVYLGLPLVEKVPLRVPAKLFAKNLDNKELEIKKQFVN